MINKFSFNLILNNETIEYRNLSRVAFYKFVKYFEEKYGEWFSDYNCIDYIVHPGDERFDIKYNQAFLLPKTNPVTKRPTNLVTNSLTS